MGSVEEDWAPGWRSPALAEVMPDLSREEQQRFQNRCRDREDKMKRYKKAGLLALQIRIPSEDARDFAIIPTVRHALRQYNARHPGGEFDPVKPLMQSCVRFRGQVWFHVNFWARSRDNNNKAIKRFFAEVHYKRSNNSLVFLAYNVPAPTPIVETCTIIEEPLSQYKCSCAFCPSHYDILHPKGCRKFVCGHVKDRFQLKLSPANDGLPFNCLPGSASQQS